MDTIIKTTKDILSEQMDAITQAITNCPDCRYNWNDKFIVFCNQHADTEAINERDYHDSVFEM